MEVWQRRCHVIEMRRSEIKSMIVRSRSAFASPSVRPTFNWDWSCPTTQTHDRPRATGEGKRGCGVTRTCQMQRHVRISPMKVSRWERHLPMNAALLICHQSSETCTVRPAFSYSSFSGRDRREALDTLATDASVCSPEHLLSRR